MITPAGEPATDTFEAALPAFEVAVMSVVRVYWSGESRQQSSGALISLLFYIAQHAQTFFWTHMTSHIRQDLPQDHFKQTAKIETTRVYIHDLLSLHKLPTPPFTRLGLLDRYLGKATALIQH